MLSGLKIQFWNSVGCERIDSVPALLQSLKPVGDQPQHDRPIQLVVDPGIFRQIRLRQLKQRGGGPQAVFLEMHKGARQLNKPLVKISIDALPIGQPQVFKDIMRLVKKLAVEAVEKTEVMRIELLSTEGFDHRGNAGAFVAHRFRIGIGRGGDEADS